MVRILVTGASGYIGSHLAKSLAEAGHRVTASARTIAPELKKALPACELIRIDVLETLEEVSGSWDCIFHTATANDIISREYRAGLEISAIGTQNVLEMARRLDVPHVVFFSTLQVYGTELNGSITEQTPVQIVNHYGLNHYVGELTCQLFSRLHGLKTTIVRPANVYGCPISRTVNRWSLVPMCFVKEALESGTITLRSSGLQRRDFVSLRQVSGACANLLEPGSALTKTCNIASGETWSMLDSARWVGQAYSKLFQQSLEINVLSNEPSAPNDFFIHSAITPAPLGGSSASEMSAEIEKLFQFFAGNTMQATRR